MNISLPRELEEFIQREVASGVYADANAVVVNALREFRHREEEGAGTAHPDDQCPPELKALLLEAVNGPHHSMPADYFAALRQRIRQTNVG